MYKSFKFLPRSKSFCRELKLFGFVLFVAECMGALNLCRDQKLFAVSVIQSSELIYCQLANLYIAN